MRLQFQQLAGSAFCLRIYLGSWFIISVIPQLDRGIQPFQEVLNPLVKPEDDDKYIDSGNDCLFVLDSYRGRYIKSWWAVAESNCGHEAFQASALPTELTAHGL